MSTLVTVHVFDAVWREGCADTPEHKHPSDFEATVEIPDYECIDEDEQGDAIFDALETQCGCCIEEGLVAIVSTIDAADNFELPEEGEEDEDDEEDYD
jgi:hypothetical protein